MALLRSALPVGMGLRGGAVRGWGDGGKGGGGERCSQRPAWDRCLGGRPAAPLRHVSRPDVAAFCLLQRWRRGGAGLRPRGRRRARTADGAGRRGAMVARGLRALRGALRGAAGSGGRRLSTRPARVPAADYQVVGARGRGRGEGAAGGRGAEPGRKGAGVRGRGPLRAGALRGGWGGGAGPAAAALR